MVPVADQVVAVPEGVGDRLDDHAGRPPEDDVLTAAGGDVGGRVGPLPATDEALEVGPVLLVHVHGELHAVPVVELAHQQADIATVPESGSDAPGVAAGFCLPAKAAG